MTKLFVGIYNSALSSLVEEIISHLAPSGYTVIPVVYGKGRSSDPRLGTHVWPGENKILLVIEEDEKIKAFLREFEKLKRSYPKEGVKAFVVNVSEVL